MVASGAITSVGDVMRGELVIRHHNPASRCPGRGCAELLAHLLVDVCPEPLLQAVYVFDAPAYFCELCGVATANPPFGRQVSGGDAHQEQGARGEARDGQRLERHERSTRLEGPRLEPAPHYRGMPYHTDQRGCPMSGFGAFRR